jgi:hypothetical protein
VTTHCRPHRSPTSAPDLDQLQLTCLLEGVLANWLPELDPLPAELADLAGLAIELPEPAELPMAVGVVDGDATTLELALHPLAGPDPVQDLFGFVAPPTWSAFGMVASGRTRALPGSAPHPAADQVVLVGLLVSRRGTSASLTWGPHPIEPSGEPAVGRIPDACRRTLGLSTEPPRSPVIELWATLWLERVLSDVLADPGSRTWPELAWAFPAFGVLSGVRSPAPTVEAVVAAGDAAQVWTWGDLRRLHAAGPVPSFGIEPADADWMDDGMFSREALGGLPRLHDLVVELGDLLAPSLSSQVERALQAWGLT